jgi:thioester reductase-like protein
MEQQRKAALEELRRAKELHAEEIQTMAAHLAMVETELDRREQQVLALLRSMMQVPK